MKTVPVTVTTSVRDIPRSCECEWTAPDCSKPCRGWARKPNPECPFHGWRIVAHAISTSSGGES